MVPRPFLQCKKVPQDVTLTPEGGRRGLARKHCTILALQHMCQELGRDTTQPGPRTASPRRGGPDREGGTLFTQFVGMTKGPLFWRPPANDVGWDKPCSPQRPPAS